MLNAKDKEYTNSSNRVEQDALEPGTYPARLVQLIDMGVQEQFAYEGKAKPPIQELMVTYEFVDEFIKDEDGNLNEEKPRWLSESFAFHNLDSELATSTKRYLALDPKITHGGDWSLLIGTPVMVTVVANPGKKKNAGKIFNKIVSTSTMRAKEADKLPELKNPGKILDLDDVSTVDILMTLPKWISDKIKDGLNFDGSPMADAVKNFKKKEAVDEPKGKAVNAKKKAPVVDEDDVPFDTDDNTDTPDNSDW